MKSEVHVRSKWIRSEPKWHRSEVEVNSKWNRSYIEVKSKWTSNEIEATPKWHWSEHEVRSEEIQVESKWNSETWNRSGVEVESKYNRLELHPPEPPIQLYLALPVSQNKYPICRFELSMVRLRVFFVIISRISHSSITNILSDCRFPVFRFCGSPRTIYRTISLWKVEEKSLIMSMGMADIKLRNVS